ncbi:SDR family oxidoreductase [Litorivivens sp.]|uniref:SDR family oxidoreductase n=1 Tax=Litorivivens sp. TaxID=2020868 RepID=UPI003568CD61
MSEQKTLIITGSNAGIGYTTALQAAKEGQRVIMACRNQSKADAARQTIVDAVPGADVLVRILDLSSFDSIRQFAASIEQEFDHIDALINNAGMMPSTLEHTTEGFEMQFGVNYLGHFLLTHLLIPVLSRSPDARIVHLSSLGHLWGNINEKNFRDRSPYLMGVTAYGQSKLANVLFSQELAQRLPANIVSNAVHPGFVDSDFFRNIPKAIYFFWRRVLVSPETSANFTLEMALAENWKDRSGEFVSAQGPLPKSPRLRNARLSQTLYEKSCQLTGATPLTKPALQAQVG